MSIAAVGAEVEVWSRSGRRSVGLDGDRVTLGKDASNDVALSEDPTVSHLHAAIERFSAGWCITDLGSTNGTFVNSERVWSTRQLRHGDEILLGQSRLVFRHSADVGRTRTEAGAQAPEVTGRERDVLRVLCRPLLQRDGRTPPRPARRGVVPRLHA